MADLNMSRTATPRHVISLGLGRLVLPRLRSFLRFSKSGSEDPARMAANRFAFDAL